MTAKIDLSRDRSKRVFAFIRENRWATMRDVATHFRVSREEIEEILKPPGVTAGLPRCEAPHCTREAHFGVETDRRRKGRWYCHSHKEQYPHAIETPQDTPEEAQRSLL